MSEDSYDDLLFDRELDRVNGRTPPSHEGSDHCCTMRVRCTLPASEVLTRAREVLGDVLRNRPPDWPDNRVTPWPSLQVWESILPRWFTDQCAPETSRAKALATARRVASLPPEWREVVDQNIAPSLGAWISCFETSRSWLWWDAILVSASEIDVSYIVFDFSYAKWSLSWLFIASGAWKIDFEE